MTDAHHPAGAIDEACRSRRARRFAPIRQHRRRQRILRERVQHVGEQQLLVLLLVLQTELDQSGRLVRRMRQQPQHRGIDVAAERADAFGGRARQQPAVGTRVTRTNGLVIGVE